MNRSSDGECIQGFEQRQRSCVLHKEHSTSNLEYEPGINNGPSLVHALLNMARSYSIKTSAIRLGGFGKKSCASYRVMKNIVSTLFLVTYITKRVEKSAHHQWLPNT